MNDTVLQITALILPLILAIVFHEVAHGYVARMLGDPTAADTILLAAIYDHMPDKTRRPAGPPADSLALVDDLGFDSVAITEMVFFIEDLFQVNVSNDEILSVRTLGDLRAFVRAKLARPTAGNAPVPPT